MARQIMAINETNHLIWDEVATDQWMETLSSRFNSEDGGYEWNIISTARYLKEEDVTAFIQKLEPQGFTIYKRWNQ